MREKGDWNLSLDGKRGLVADVGGETRGRQAKRARIIRPRVSFLGIGTKYCLGKRTHLELVIRRGSVSLGTF